MRVLFVSNNIFMKGNGICTSAQVTVKYLREAGVDVRFLAGRNTNPKGQQPDFSLKLVHVPIFEGLVESNGFRFAHRENEIIRKAVEWADVIHIEEPFWLQRRAIDFAEKMNKPVVGTFHLYPQNVMYELPIPFKGDINSLYMKFWKWKYYDHCSHLQCPSRPVKELLEKYGFKAKLHVISNGIRIPDKPVTIREPEYPPYKIISIGRYSRIKGQRTLLEAMNYSKYADKILLYFAGKGSEKINLEKMADDMVTRGTLKYPPIFAFHTHEGLRKAIRSSYLYVHSAFMEVEGLGCIEAVREGIVPVIAQGELVGTSDFALDERSLYPAGNARILAEKIDWWIEHPEERREMAGKYADSAHNYDIRLSIGKLLAMYNEALEK